MKRSHSILFALFVFIIAYGCNSSSPDSYHPAGKPGEIIFSFQADGEIRSTPAIGDNGAIYFGTQNATLYAINYKGRKKWQWRYDCESDSLCPQAFEGSPAIGDDGTIHVGDDLYFPHYFFAVFPKGKKKWEYMPDGPIGAIDASPALLSDGTIFAGASGGGRNGPHGEIIALSQDGTPLDGFPLNTGAIKVSPVVVDNVFVAGETGQYTDRGKADTLDDWTIKRWNSILAVNKDSRIIWRTELDKIEYNLKTDTDKMENNMKNKTPFDTVSSVSLSSLAVDHNKTIFVAQNMTSWDEKLSYSNIFQIDPVNGKIIFRMEIPTRSKVVGSPVIDSSLNGADVIIATKNGHIISFNPYSDKDIINFDLDLGENSEAVGSPVIGDNNRIYLAVNRHYDTDRIDVFEIDKNGVINKGFNVTILNEHVSSSLAMNRRGVIYFGTKEGRLHAVQTNATGLSTTAPWPTFRHDAKNTGNSGL